MSTIVLSNSQKKDILKNFREVEMHNELKLLFEKMYPNATSVYKTHGKDEMGRDLIISQQTPVGKENIAVVVKMDKISGSASEKVLFEIVTQINQCFQVPKSVNDQLSPLETHKVFVCIFGEISNKAQTNLDANIRAHAGKVLFFDIEKLLEFFTKHYPNVFLGASTLEALNHKRDELEQQLFAKSKFLKTSFIEPNLRMFKKSKNELIAISKNSDDQKLGKTIGENIFGEKETIHSIAVKALKSPYKMLIEGEAGSGKTVFVLKLMIHIIEETIRNIDVVKKDELDKIKSPILVKATKLSNGKCLKEVIEDFYKNNESSLAPNLLMIDGMDEVKNEVKEKIIKDCESYVQENKISLIFTSRKSTEVNKRLHDYDKYELLPFEISQAINYMKKIAEHNQILLSALIKGLERVKHQIPLYPMSLSLLIEIAEKQKEVPSSISELYKQYIEMATSQYRDGEEISLLFEPRIKMAFFEDLAYNLFYKNNVISVKRDTFDIFIDEYLINSSIIDDKEAFLEDLERTSLIKISHSTVEFLHKSFLDYFVASYFKDKQTSLYEQGEFDTIYALYHTSLWEDVTYFYFGQKTIITKKEIDKILNSAPLEYPELVQHLGELMIGKLLQFAWLTESDVKEHAINQSIGNILKLRQELLIFTEEEFGMNLPKILGDIQILHYMDEAFASRWLSHESQNVINDIFQSNKNPNLFYFATLYILGNSSLIGLEYTEKFLDSFLAILEEMPPEISVPLINLVKVFQNKNKLKTTEEQVKALNRLNIRIGKKYKKQTIEYLNFKNKLDKMKLQQLRENNKKH